MNLAGILIAALAFAVTFGLARLIMRRQAARKAREAGEASRHNQSRQVRRARERRDKA
ncbi:MAG: hypothetical protein HYX47_03800 [Burkholderiales bacterium]|nr:hypothetical protein [Burkholderiales bacterium]